MNTIHPLRAPLLVLLALAGLGAISLAWSAQELPPQVASHFGAQGKADKWMSKSDYLKSMGVIGLVIPIFLVGVGSMTKMLPSGSLNIPHREYWLSAERRADTNRYISGHMAWLACVALFLLLSIHWLVVEANRAAPAVLSNLIWLLLIAFFGGVATWLFVMVRHFSRPPTETA